MINTGVADSIVCFQVVLLALQGGLYLYEPSVGHRGLVYNGALVVISLVVATLARRVQ